jgi:L-rhamnose mutarotase
MQRIGRMRRLRPGAEEEYERRHREVWPEVLAAIQRAGIQRYTIFRHECRLFSYFELPDEASLLEVAEIFLQDETCCRWEAVMEALVEPPTASDNGGWQVMTEVFHVDGAYADPV